MRRDTVTSSAGDAVASNSAVQIPTPWPRYSDNPNIAFDGEKNSLAVKRYREDKEFLPREPEWHKETQEIGPGTDSGAGAATGAGAAAGPPPGQGYGAWRGGRAVRAIEAERATAGGIIEPGRGGCGAGTRLLSAKKIDQRRNQVARRRAASDRRSRSLGATHFSA